MQFSSKEDIEAPIDQVFAMLSEFETFERRAIGRGIDVLRQGEPSGPAGGLRWQVNFSMRGKRRDMQLHLETYDPPNLMLFVSESQGVHGQMILELVPLSPRRTRMAVVLNLRPKTISARLLIQSLKLAKANLTKRFKLRVADYAKSLEDRYQRNA